MSARYASETTVSTAKSRDEIEATLKRYGATAFGYATEERRAMVKFRIADRFIRFDLFLPDPKAKEFTHSSRGLREQSVIDKAWEQACRQRWRALALVIKAKLEAVAAGITTVEDEFLAHTMLPDGSTVGQWAKPQLALAYSEQRMPATLPIDGPRS